MFRQIVERPQPFTEWRRGQAPTRQWALLREPPVAQSSDELEPERRLARLGVPPPVPPGD